MTTTNTTTIKREFWVTNGESWSQTGICRNGTDTGIPFTTYRAAKRMADRDNIEWRNPSARKEGVTYFFHYVAEFSHGHLVKVTS